MSRLAHKTPIDSVNAGRVVWRALPGSQALALSCPGHIILYEGTRGPGKTDAQLMRFRRNVGKGYGRFWRGIICDREYKNLDDLVQKSLRWFPQFNDGAKFLSSKSDYKWVWPTGEELLFRVLKRPGDYWNYHGHEYPFIGWNELTKYLNADLFEAMMSTNRTSFVPTLHSPTGKDGEMFVLPPIPLEVFATTNPYGIGHMWVKRVFIDPAPPGVPVVREISVFNPLTQERTTIKKYQVRIFGSYKENIFLPLEYIAELESITEENKRKAWLHGDWNIVAGGAFDDLWKEDIHVVPRFKVPPGWKISRSFDWGSSHPFSVGWWAETNGEAVTLPDGRMFNPPKRSLVRIAEWYGSKGATGGEDDIIEPISGQIGFNTGVKFSSKRIALGIKAMEKHLKRKGWITGKVLPGPADNQIRDVREQDVPTIESKMAAEGVQWSVSDKSNGSRKIGLQLIRDRLEAATEGEGRALYFMDNCRIAIAGLPTLPRDEDEMDDVDTEAEDHFYDDIRYKILEADADYATDLRNFKTW